LTKLLLIAGGGAVGAVGRYYLAGWTQALARGTFPIGTLAVNVLGCLLIGMLGAFFGGPHLVRQEYRLLLMVGLLGGFTTFSTFGLETVTLINEGQFGQAGLNVLLSNGLGLLAVWLGYRTTQWMLGA
jgi:CrcB protein